eukprot:1625701-Amphidinium_carterae.1
MGAAHLLSCGFAHLTCDDTRFLNLLYKSDHEEILIWTNRKEMDPLTSQQTTLQMSNIFHRLTDVQFQI